MSAYELFKNFTHVAVKYSYSLKHVQCMCTSRGHDVRTNDQFYGNYAHIEDQSFGDMMHVQ